MKYTRWFGPDEKPGEKMVGVYPVKIADGEDGFSLWSGKQWGMLSGSVAVANEWPLFSFARQDLLWRGLTAKDRK